MLELHSHPVIVVWCTSVAHRQCCALQCIQKRAERNREGRWILGSSEQAPNNGKSAQNALSAAYPSQRHPTRPNGPNPCGPIASSEWWRDPAHRRFVFLKISESWRSWARLSRRQTMVNRPRTHSRRAIRASSTPLGPTDRSSAARPLVASGGDHLGPLPKSVPRVSFRKLTHLPEN